MYLMVMKISNSALLAFYTVAQEGHFTLASKRLGITQSALSQRILNLEKDLSKTLFIRLKTGASLTEEGEALLQYCRQLVALEDEFLGDFSQSAKKIKSFEGHIRIGGFSSIMRSQVLPALVPLLKNNPEVKLTFISSEIRHLPALFLQGKIDYLILNYKWSKENIVSEELGTERNVLVQKKGYSGPEIYLDHDEHDPSTMKYLKMAEKNFYKIKRRYLDEIYGLVDGVKLEIGRAIIPYHLVKNIKELEIINPDKELKIPIILHYHQRSYYTQLQKEIIALLKSFFKENL